MKVKTAKALNEKIILQAYDEFKVFICNEALPKFSIRYKPDASDGVIATYKNEKGNHIITIDTRFPYAGKQLYNRVLFHEFTHLLDNANTENKFNDNAYRYFTEFHAAKIAMLFSLGCNAINAFENIIYSQEIISELQSKQLAYKHQTDLLFQGMPNYDNVEYNCAHLSGDVAAINLVFPSHANQILTLDILPIPYLEYVTEIHNLFNESHVGETEIKTCDLLLRTAAIKHVNSLVEAL